MMDKGICVLCVREVNIEEEALALRMLCLFGMEKQHKSASSMCVPPLPPSQETN